METTSWIAIMTALAIFFSPLAAIKYNQYLTKKNENKNTLPSKDIVYRKVLISWIIIQIILILINAMFIYGLLKSTDPLTRQVVFQFTLHVGSIFFIVLVMTFTGLINKLIDLMEKASVLREKD